MNDTIVVFGAGQIGSQVTEPLLAAGHRVRQVRRSGQASTKGALEVRVGDLSDLSFAKALIQPFIASTAFAESCPATRRQG